MAGENTNQGNQNSNGNANNASGNSDNSGNQNQNQNQSQNQNSNGDQGNQNPGGQNNSEITTPLHTGIWDNHESNQGNQNDNQNQNNQQNQNQNQSQNQNQQTPEELMQAHISSLGLTNGIDVEGLSDSLRDGDTKPLLSMMETAAANSYKAAVENLSSLMDSKVAAAVEAATAKAEGNVNASMAVKEMQKVLPFTTAPDLEPVAKAVLTKLMNDGRSVTEAIQGTDQFFKAITEQGMNHYDSMHEQRPGRSDSRGNQQQSQADGYWSDLLQGISGSPDESNT